MSGKIVNLSRAPKSRARDDARRQADANAAKHGRSKSERDAEAARAAKATRDHESHKRDE